MSEQVPSASSASASAAVASLPLADLPPGALKQVHIDGQAVCVANVDGQVYAVSDTCTHARIPLSGGSLEGRQVVCPWHGAMFDLKTGAATCGPASTPLRTFAVTVDSGTITIRPQPHPGA
jgi:3-phenylpropionate/trans-cinnamate dioxygenase ferredoxin subunit